MHPAETLHGAARLPPGAQRAPRRRARFRSPAPDQATLTQCTGSLLFPRLCLIQAWTEIDCFAQNKGNHSPFPSNRMTPHLRRALPRSPGEAQFGRPRAEHVAPAGACARHDLDLPVRQQLGHAEQDVGRERRPARAARLPARGQLLRPPPPQRALAQRPARKRDLQRSKLLQLSHDRPLISTNLAADSAGH